MGRFMLLQLDAFVREFLIRLGGGADGEVSMDAREAALEGMLDFLSQPQFLTDIYASLDCRVERPNLFEEICALLGRTAQPPKGGSATVSQLQSLAVEGFACMLQVLDAACQSGAQPASQFAEKVPALRRLLRATAGIESPADGADARGGSGGGGPADAVGTSGDGGEWIDLWGLVNSRGWVSIAQVQGGVDLGSKQKNVALGCLLEKQCKEVLATAAAHFNKSPKRGYEYLQQAGLLPDPLTPKAVAAFLRYTRGLENSLKGELLGEHDEFSISVLHEFVKTFDFSDMHVEDALRVMMDTFRTPGESQKIERITDAFAIWYFDSSSQVPWARHKDMIHVLAFAINMLHTDAHSAHVKKKMTCEQFMRNLRATNKYDHNNSQEVGIDPPKEVLARIYQSITTTEMKMSEDVEGLTYAQLLALRQDGRHLRGQTLRLSPSECPFIDIMVSHVWGPAVSALAVILDYAHDEQMVAQCLTGVKSLVRIAAHFHMSEVVDSVVLSLCRLTRGLHSGQNSVVVGFGKDVGLQMIVEAVFEMAHEYPEHLASAWRQIADLVVRMTQVRLIHVAEDIGQLVGDEPPSRAGSESGTADGQGKAAADGPEGQGEEAGEAAGSGRSVMDFFGIGGSKGPAKDQEEQSDEDARLERLAHESAARCRVGDFWSDSRYFPEASLTAFVDSLVVATGLDAGSVAETKQRLHGMPEAERLAALSGGVTMLAAVAVRNKDRVSVVWPALQAALAGILPAGAPLAQLLGARESVLELVKKAVSAVMHLCRRMSHNDEGFEQCLMQSLQLIVRTDTAVMWDLAVFLANELRMLLRFSAFRITQPAAWKPLSHVMGMCALNVQACPGVVEALVGLVKSQPPQMGLAGFESVVWMLVKVYDAREETGQPADARLAGLVVSTLEDLGAWLCASSLGQAQSGEGCPRGSTAEQRMGLLRDAWKSYVRASVRLAQTANPAVRNATLAALQRFVTKSEALPLGSEAWAEVLVGEGGLVLMLEKLLSLVGRPAFPEGEKTMHLGLLAMSRALTQDIDVSQVWQQGLVVLESCTSLGSPDLAETVPDILRNLLLVLSQRGVLRPGWRDRGGRDLWQITWRMSRSISPSLTPEQLMPLSGQRT